MVNIMTTYPVYEALFLGSNDCMCHIRVMMAAKDKRDALRKFKTKQNARGNTLGKIGRWDAEYKTNVCDETAVKLIRSIIATTLSWNDHQYIT